MQPGDVVTANPAFPRCDHGNSAVTCGPCLDDAVNEMAVLAELEDDQP